MVSVGEQAPDFTLPNQDGQPVTLSSLRGQKVIIFAFPKANTAGCTAQACAFRDQFPQISSENAVILGISADSPDELKRWKISQKLPYDLLSDPDQEVINSWGAEGMNLLGLVQVTRTTRSYWVLDENGRIIDMQIGVGPRQSVERALKAVQQAETTV